MKKLTSLFLALVLALTLSIPVLAASPEQAQSSAELLYDLGLFRGVGTNEDGIPNFALNRAPNRVEAVTILVRLLGAEKEAQSQTWSLPFRDVPDWAKSYVGYAYAKGYTKGVAADRFSSASPVTAAQMLTFILRALGYQDGTDFTWNAPWALSDKLQLTNGEYPAQKEFLRGDTVVICANALYAPVKSTGQTLLEVLAAGGAFEGSDAVLWDCDPVAFSGEYYPS